MNAVLKSVHLQLTRRCNLRCSMCGQWGEQGYQKARTGDPEFGLEDWRKVARELDGLPHRLGITLWGGEPLMAPFCAELAAELKGRGHRLSMVTNGILLAERAKALAGHLDSVFVSVDGPSEVHDKVRGAPGLFKRTGEGLLALRAADPAAHVVVMTCMTRENEGRLAELLPHLDAWGIKNWIIGPQMYLSEARAPRYEAFTRAWADAPTATASWKASFPAGYGKARRAELESLKRTRPDLSLTFGSNRLSASGVEHWFEEPDRNLGGTCFTPWRRLSIQSDGETSFCLDITDGSLGNVRTAGVMGVWEGERARAFRGAIEALANPACVRCIWNLHDDV